jgi:hypothetical protein
MSDFYNQLKPLETFLGFSDGAFYAQAPEDWLVVIADIEGSTKAIEAGKYKWVNMAGASSIVALVNALGHKDFPFVFGGDGATALIPESSREVAERYLRAARKNTQEAFQLNLRIGIISHRELIVAGSPVEVARYQLPHGPSIAFFRGDGLGLAEKWVKSGRGLIADGPEAENDLALKGLSCRWAPLKSWQGAMLSIIVKPRATGSQAEATLAAVAKKIDDIVDLEDAITHPVKADAFKPEKLWKATTAEANLQARKPRWLGIMKVLFEMLAVRALDRFNIKLPGLNFRKYKASLVSHSDYRKYDEQLRLVIDCTPTMRDRIRSFLDEERKRGSLHFGLFESDEALMTCFLQSFDEGGHIHFVDGNRGGYTMAAKELKAQMKADVT